MVDYKREIDKRKDEIKRIEHEIECLEVDEREQNALTAMNERISELAASVLSRMRDGDIPVRGTAGWWWANNGDLLCKVGRDELTAIQKLAFSGVIEKAKARQEKRRD